MKINLSVRPSLLGVAFTYKKYVVKLRKATLVSQCGMICLIKCFLLTSTWDQLFRLVDCYLQGQQQEVYSGKVTHDVY